MRGRWEKGQVERERKAGPGGSRLDLSQPLMASLLLGVQVEGSCCGQGLGGRGRLMETKLLCQPECQVPSVTRVPLAGNEAGARSPRGGNDRCTEWGRGGHNGIF